MSGEDDMAHGRALNHALGPQSNLCTTHRLPASHKLVQTAVRVFHAPLPSYLASVDAMYGLLQTVESRTEPIVLRLRRSSRDCLAFMKDASLKSFAHGGWMLGRISAVGEAEAEAEALSFGW
ncbi:hypothetical protein CVT25_000512 [Psilocybe cyanescens]|uniref:Uncharacterized protein n=1 Tax=Psilocybe cyanescens TaxID=93625 RepID=A0A409XWC5_PSICY|nr:hypothetical protein CVT25_000512 [Psilocybe cyanescens]